MRYLLGLALVGCGGGSDATPDGSVDAPELDAAICAPVSPTPTNCDAAGTCPASTIANDAPFTGPGPFHGHADPTLLRDPADANRMWLGYSWPHVVQGTAPGGATVLMAAVENHLAVSNDNGATFTFVRDLWPAVSAADPEGSGETGMFSSETASFATITNGNTTTWYGAHLRYFLRPMNGYKPKYGTSWQVRIGAAASTSQLPGAPEAILGVSTTAAAYQPHARLDQLAGLPIQHCAMLNNPTLFAQQGTLYLVVECLAFVGQNIDFANSTVQVFATVPGGAPATWTWRHAGKLADHDLAVELGSETIQQPDISLAQDGTPIFVITPAHADPDLAVGTAGDGCVAIELASIDPPMLKRDCAGKAVVRARVDGTQLKACTHDARSTTGLFGMSEDVAGGNFTLRRTGVRP